MGDIAKNFANLISNHIPESIGIAIFLFCLFFEISKVKVYPLRWLWRLISFPFRKIDEQRTNSFKNIAKTIQVDIDTKLKEMTESGYSNCKSMKEGFAELEKRFDKLDEKQQKLEERLDTLAAARIKNHVLNFARQCRRGEKHSREDYNNLFKENAQYLELVKKYDWVNDVYKHDFAYIEHVYDECNLNSDFLGE